MPERDAGVDAAAARDLSRAFVDLLRAEPWPGASPSTSPGFVSPRLPDEGPVPVLALRTRLAVRKHGQGAVVSALSRAERAPRTISAF